MPLGAKFVSQWKKWRPWRCTLRSAGFEDPGRLWRRVAIGFGSDVAGDREVRSRDANRVTDRP